MAMKISFKDEVKSRTDILEIIGEYAWIETDSPHKWKEGDCPFCENGGRKILVEPDEQVFKCPCCNKQGDVFTFVELKKHYSFMEALIELANRAGIEIPKKIKTKNTNGHSDMNDKPRRKIFGFFKRSIPYFKDLRKMAGSVTASVLMAQLEYWFEDKEGQDFYKFLEPPPDGHPAYKSGDSWCEELAFSKDEFRAAFDKIGIRYLSKTKFMKADPESIFINDDGREMFYCSYFDKVRGTTHYFRNPKTDDLLDEMLKNSGNIKIQSPKMKHQKT